MACFWKRNDHFRLRLGTGFGQWLFDSNVVREPSRVLGREIKTSSIPVIWTTGSVPHSELHFSMRVWPHRLALCLSTDMFQRFQSLFWPLLAGQHEPLSRICSDKTQTIKGAFIRKLLQLTRKVMLHKKIYFSWKISKNP